MGLKILSFVNCVVTVFARHVHHAHSFAITGISAGVQSSGERPFRTEINQFASSGAPFDLFVLATQAIQQLNESELLSFFQISGIHGYPTIEWDNAPGNPVWGWGYCTHDSVLFPTWHRPYVALYEQVLWQNAQTIAATYPEDQVDEYVNAASTFRMPYWDWAINPTIPAVATTPTININTPTGYYAIANPLFNYTFHSRPAGNGFPDSDPEGSPPFTEYMSTVRWPDANNQSQNGVASQNLQQNSAFLLNTVYDILSSNSNYTQISTDAVSQVSIEYVHDAVHYFVGGPGGHMDYLTWAGFDPMFWLHHTNVDRLLAIWQALYPDSWISPWDSASNYAIPPDTEVNADSSLSPFHFNDQGGFYTSNTVRWDKYFGYAYPEVVDWSTSNATALSASVRTAVNQLYNPSAGTTNSSSTVKKLRYRRSPSTTASASAVLDALEPLTPSLYQDLDTPNLPIQWTANLQVSKTAATALNTSQSFNIDLFLGPPPADQTLWPLATNLVGTFPILSSLMPVVPGPSSSISPVTKHASIPLTPSLALLVSKNLLASLEPQDVTPFLTQQLVARVRFHNPGNDAGGDQGDGEVETGDLEGFGISVASRTVQAPKSLQDFPTYGSWVQWPSVTENLK